MTGDLWEFFRYLDLLENKRSTKPDYGGWQALSLVRCFKSEGNSYVIRIGKYFRIEQRVVR